MDYRIRYYGDSFLRKKAESVVVFNEELQEFIRKLVELMYIHDGVGLAAPQIGVSHRLFVIDEGTGKGWQAIVNPEILEKSPEFTESEEGCLSLPGIFENITRPNWVKVRYQNPDGCFVEEIKQEYAGTVFQHELDHLNGILFIDHLGIAKRRLLKRQLQAIQGKSADTAAKALGDTVAKTSADTVAKTSADTVASAQRNF